ncbi:MAG TPA: MFS transporter [Candidatus Caccocola faecipullorum]|nr:MFS transporter [Candidatus Caccocola faecipullorum]
MDGNNGGRFFSSLFFRLWIPFGFAFFLGMFIGSVNSVLAPYITEEFSLTPAALGFVSSMNLAAFGAAQLPLGLMLDRFGGRKTLIAMLSFALAGTFLFACAQSYVMLICARALIGFGFAAALMSAFKSFAHWLPQEYLPLAFSLESLMGGIGVMSATRPVTLALQYRSWREIMFAASAAVLIAILLLVFLAPREAAGRGGGRQSLLRAAKEMFGFVTDKRFLYVAPVVAVADGVLFAFAYLWIGPWLRDVAMLDGSEIGLMMLLSSTGIAAGYLMNGVIASFLSRKGWLTWEEFYFFAGFLFSVFIAAIIFFGGAAAPLWCCVMFCSTMTMISFSITGRLFEPDVAGRAFSLLNFTIFVVSFLLQWFIGVIINLYPVSGGKFAAEGYHWALVFILALSAAALAHLFFALPKLKKLGKNPKL